MTQYIPHVSKAYAASNFTTNCNNSRTGAAGIQTAIGCLPVTMPEIVSELLRMATMIGGMVAVGMLAAGGFGLMTSSGDPEKLMNAKETINNALMGLALIVLSVFILELVGVEILGIAYLGRNL
ncbi:MAG: hypothetical protein ABIC57_02850 [bacterium]